MALEKASLDHNEHNKKGRSVDTLVKHFIKKSKSRMGVLLRADLTGHHHATQIGSKGLDGRALLGQPSKGHLYGTYFALFLFVDFRIVQE